MRSNKYYAVPEEGEKLEHRSHKYIKKVRKNGKWVYYYAPDKKSFYKKSEDQRQIANMYGKMAFDAGWNNGINTLDAEQDERLAKEIAGDIKSQLEYNDKHSNSVTRWLKEKNAEFSERKASAAKKREKAAEWEKKGQSYDATASKERDKYYKQRAADSAEYGKAANAFKRKVSGSSSLGTNNSNTTSKLKAQSNAKKLSTSGSLEKAKQEQAGYKKAASGLYETVNKKNVSAANKYSKKAKEASNKVASIGSSINAAKRKASGSSSLANQKQSTKKKKTSKVAKTLKKGQSIINKLLGR